MAPPSVAPSAASPVASSKTEQALEEARAQGLSQEVCATIKPLSARPKWPPFPERWQAVEKSTQSLCHGSKKVARVTTYDSCDGYRAVSVSVDMHDGITAFYDSATDALLGIVGHNCIWGACAQFGQNPDLAWGNCVGQDACTGEPRVRRRLTSR
jgi:hypothetical protein